MKICTALACLLLSSCNACYTSLWALGFYQRREVKAMDSLNNFYMRGAGECTSSNPPRCLEGP